MGVKTMMMLSEGWDLFDRNDLTQLIEAARIAERAGITGVASSEHVVLGKDSSAVGPKFNPREFDAPGNQSPDTPWPSSLMLLSAVAAACPSLELYAAAIIPVLRHPLQVAKDLATLDQLSRGKLHVFPTVSWSRDEYAALGQPFEQRGKMLDEHFEIWQLAWAEGPASYAGKHFQFEDVWCEPKPFRPGGPPLWITGDKLHAAALRRLVKYGSAFAPLGPVSPEDKERIHQAFAEAGRDASGLGYLGALFGTFDTPDGVADFDKACEQIPGHVASGCNVIAFKPSQYIDRIEDLEDLCRTFVARVRDCEGA